jgi:hypothetical protein
MLEFLKGGRSVRLVSEVKDDAQLWSSAGAKSPVTLVVPRSLE